jgi:hypothetical protein
MIKQILAFNSLSKYFLAIFFIIIYFILKQTRTKSQLNQSEMNETQMRSLTRFSSFVRSFVFNYDIISVRRQYTHYLQE